MATRRQETWSASALCAACVLATFVWPAFALADTTSPNTNTEERQRGTLPADSMLLDLPADEAAEAVAPVGEPPAELAAGDATTEAEPIEPEVRAQPQSQAEETDETPLQPEAESALGAIAPAAVDATDDQTLPGRGDWMDPRTQALEEQPLGASEAAGPDGAPSPQASAFGVWGMLRTLLALGVVVGLVFACRGLIRKAVKNSSSLSVLLSAGGRAPSGVLEVLGRYPIARRTTLVLLKIDRRVLLLSQSEQGFQTLAEITDPDEVASILMKTSSEQSESLTDRFQSIFQQYERGKGVENTPVAPEIVDLTGSRNPLVSLRLRLAGMQERQA